MIQDLLREAYVARLRRQLHGGPLPRHLGLIMDGNRRWARRLGMAPSLGHRHGALHVERVLGWCDRLGIEHVTVFVCSRENLERRGDEEVAFLMRVVEEVVAETLARPGGRWRVHVAGDLDVLPDTTARALKEAVEATRDLPQGRHVTLAVGYGGRQEVVAAVRRLLAERAAAGASLADVAGSLSDADIAAHLDTAGMPDPELVVRTSGEQRLSNFLLWQGASARVEFCDVYWPGFREVDLLRALRSWAAPQRPVER